MLDIQPLRAPIHRHRHIRANYSVGLVQLAHIHHGQGLSDHGLHWRCRALGRGAVLRHILRAGRKRKKGGENQGAGHDGSFNGIGTKPNRASATPHLISIGMQTGLREGRDMLN
jgi:hypothetical protein